MATPDGGGLLALSIEQDGRRHNILRPASPEPSTPLDRAMIVMAPWCNRIGGGGFRVGDHFYPVTPNVAGFPMPLHGSAFQRQWKICEEQEDRVSLRLDDPNPANFRYCAEIVYELSPTTLKVGLTVINTGPNAMPFGIGLHPWFETSDQTRLQFHADQQVFSDSAGLPMHISPIMDDFGVARTLPAHRIDSTFPGWDGAARLHHRHGVVKVHSKAPMLHVFSPSQAAGFCCLEPQTTMPNAANFCSTEEALLASGGRVDLAMAISFSRFSDPSGSTGT